MIDKICEVNRRPPFLFRFIDEIDIENEKVFSLKKDKQWERHLLKGAKRNVAARVRRPKASKTRKTKEIYLTQKSNFNLL